MSTITPEKLPDRLRDLAENAWTGPGPRGIQWVKDTQEAMSQAADALETALAEVQRLTRNAKHAAALEAREWGDVVQAPYDDCECVVCETLRNPPPPTEALKELMRKYWENPARRREP